jgi:hypothetical protein
MWFRAVFEILWRTVIFAKDLERIRRFGSYEPAREQSRS